MRLGGFGWRGALPAVVLCGVLGLTFAQAAQAEPVTVSIRAEVPAEVQASPVSWAAVAVGLFEAADPLATLGAKPDAMSVTPEALIEPWTVALEPGAYLISGFTGEVFYETEVVITEASSEIVVPMVIIESQAALRCKDAAHCAYADPATGLQVTVPQGWSIEPPYHADLGDGTLAPEISTELSWDTNGDISAIWLLNPPDWRDGLDGPCRKVSLGKLCTFEESAESEAAFAIIAPSLAQSAVEPAAAP